jgi:hypothetical protein
VIFEIDLVLKIWERVISTYVICCKGLLDSKYFTNRVAAEEEKQDFFVSGFMIAMLSMVLILSVQGESYAFDLKERTICVQNNGYSVTANPNGPPFIGTPATFPGRVTIFDVKGKNFAVTGSNNPSPGVTAYYSGAGQKIGNKLQMVVSGAFDIPADPTTNSNEMRLGGVWNITLKCDAKGESCDGSAYGLWNIIYCPTCQGGANGVSPGFSQGYSVGTVTEEPCK